MVTKSNLLYRLAAHSERDPEWMHAIRRRPCFVYASSEEEARQLAAKKFSHEGQHEHSPWLNVDLVKCTIAADVSSTPLPDIAHVVDDEQQ
jgi:hypothetical protein